MNKKRATLALCFVITMSADVRAETSAFTGPTGSSVYHTSCTSDMSNCYREAAQTCRSPYQILTSESHAGGWLSDSIPGPVTYYSMQYRCGKSDGRVANFPHRGGVYVPPRVHTNDCYIYGSNNYGNVNCVGIY
jgi:hypothetical protein